jgi:ZIP family zinc transporter
MPERSRGRSRKRAFLYGALSGAVEPIGAFVTILAASIIVPALPFFLGFAAGAMLYVVGEELIPEVSRSGHTHVGNMMFSLGFTLMMTLDVALG